jgi:hypothetical protein
MPAISMFYGSAIYLYFCDDERKLPLSMRNTRPGSFIFHH